MNGQGRLDLYTATTRNLALGGASFETMEQFNVGEEVNLLLYIPVNKELELLKASSEIVWVEDDAGGHTTTQLFFFGAVDQPQIQATGDQRIGDGLDRLFARWRRQNRRKTRSEHRLPRAWRSGEDQIVRAGRGDLECASGSRLSFYFREIDRVASRRPRDGDTSRVRYRCVVSTCE